MATIKRFSDIVQLVRFKRINGKKVSGYMDAKENWIGSDYGVQILDESGNLIAIASLDGECLSGNFEWCLAKGKVPKAEQQCFDEWQ